MASDDNNIIELKANNSIEVTDSSPLKEQQNSSDWIKKAEVLGEALPFMRKFAGETFVIKFGGSAMGSDEAIMNFANNIVLLKQVGINPVIVHGGGPQIGSMLDRLNIESSFVDGLRVTDSQGLEIVEMVLSGSINKMIVQKINEAGGRAIGISGKDGGFIKAKRITKTGKDPDSNIEKIVNYGFVGEPYCIDTDILSIFEDSDVIPVIAPIGVGENGETFNINADTAAGHIASALEACKLIILSDVDGVILENGELISHLNSTTAKQLIKDGVVKGGMIPKTEICLFALENDVQYAHILNGGISNILLMEIFTEKGAGTMIL
jgi:acetylglutamate kinase